MTYTIIFSEKASQQLAKLDRTIQKRIIAVLERVKIKPERYVTKLVGDPAFKLRVGDYRVILDIEHNELRILILMIGHRKNIYD